MHMHIQTHIHKEEDQMQSTEILNPIQKLDYKVKDQIPKPISLLLHHGALKCQAMARDFRNAHLNVSVLLKVKMRCL